MQVVVFTRKSVRIFESGWTRKARQRGISTLSCIASYGTDIF